MEAGFMVIIALIVGIVIGIFIGMPIEKSRAYRRVSKGFIYADCRDTTKQPQLYLQCTVPIEDITSRKQALFDITVLE